jgi:hypothetical protein
MPAFDAPQHKMNIDGSGETWVSRFDGDPSKLDFLRCDLTNLAYAIRHQGRSAVIGVGGGRDLLSAYLFGFRDLTGVELNPIFIDLLTRQFRDYNQLADVPGVRLFVDEARSWFARTAERFDLIQMSLTDTWAATGAGAYSLSENGLYTVQGWHHFLSALTPNGVFTVSRWFNPKDITETGRLVSLAAAALRAEGIEQPRNHLFLARTENLAPLSWQNRHSVPTSWQRCERKPPISVLMSCSVRTSRTDRPSWHRLSRRKPLMRWQHCRPVCIVMFRSQPTIGPSSSTSSTPSIRHRL